MIYFIVLIGLCVVGLAIQISFITVEHKKKYLPALVLKGLASCVFVAIGSLAFVLSKNKNFSSLVLAGLVMGAVGDILLNLRFVLEKIGQKLFLAGIAAFFAGHILYMIAIIPLCPYLWKCIAIGEFVAAMLLLIIFTTMKDIKQAFKIFGVFYIGAVIVMTSIAIGNFIGYPQSLNGIVFMFGAILFAASDIVLVFNTFGKKQRFSLRISNLTLYYLGQLLIAMSIVFI